MSTNDEKPHASLDEAFSASKKPAATSNALIKKFRRELLKGDAEHQKRLERVRKEITRGGRRTKGNIV